MEKQAISTRQALVETAGELFAEHGYDGVSTRMIAESAGVQLGSIHYHFGSKENLYIEAFKFAKERGQCAGFADVLAENPFLAETPAGQAELIRNAVFRRFHDYFRPDRPKWETQILVREIMNPSTAMPALSEKVFKPDVMGTIDFFHKVKPGASDFEAFAWADILHSQLFLYTMAKRQLELIRGQESMTPEFFREAARTVSRAMILVLELPLPQDLK